MKTAIFSLTALQRFQNLDKGDVEDTQNPRRGYILTVHPPEFSLKSAKP
jgi:hypothetical protein